MIRSLASLLLVVFILFLAGCSEDDNKCDSRDKACLASCLTAECSGFAKGSDSYLECAKNCGVPDNFMSDPSAVADDGSDQTDSSGDAGDE